MSSDQSVNNQPNTQEVETHKPVQSSGIANIPKEILDVARKQQDEIHRLAGTQAGSDESQPKWYLDQLKAEREKESEQKDTSQAQSKESQAKDKEPPKEDQAKESAKETQPKEGQSTPKESQPKPKESQPKEKESQPKEKESKDIKEESQPKEQPKEKESQPKEKESQPKEDQEKPLPKEQPKELSEVTGARPPADTSQPQDTKDHIGQESGSDSEGDKSIIDKIKDKAAEWKESVNGIIQKSAEHQVLPHRPPRVRAVQHAQEHEGLDLQDRHRVIRETEADMHKEPLDNASMERVHEHTKQEGLDIFSRIKQSFGLQDKGKEVDLSGKDPSGKEDREER